MFDRESPFPWTDGCFLETHSYPIIEKVEGVFLPRDELDTAPNHSIDPLHRVLYPAVGSLFLESLARFRCQQLIAAF